MNRANRVEPRTDNPSLCLERRHRDGFFNDNNDGGYKDDNPGNDFNTAKALVRSKLHFNAGI
ncbi:hypothetical protein GCM10009001_18910 [Virgibacillus siamensis]|uniref:Uncharacterized protein n=1 Tax=Virgibacillus siamensis TaxID=480071 RepID=A0ABP3R485_9BACI